MESKSKTSREANITVLQDYFIPIDPHLSKISLDVHEEIYRLLKHRRPKAEFFAEEPELMQLYLALILIRRGLLSFEERDTEAKNVIRMEINTLCLEILSDNSEERRPIRSFNSSNRNPQYPEHLRFDKG